MKKLGIWLDKEKAHIVRLENDSAAMTTIESNIENFKIHGGSGTRLKGGPQDVVQDSKYLERDKYQLRAYFKVLVSKIKDADAIVLFGPAQTNEKFNKGLQENYEDLAAKVKAVKTVDSMTDNQVKALIRDFYHS